MEREAFLSDETQSLDSSSARDPSPRPSRGPQSFYICIFALKFSTQLIASLLEIPLLRLVEHAICRVDILQIPNEPSEALCKTPVVQNRLAFIMGYKTTFDALPCILCAIFYGYVADSRGRKYVMLLAISGQVLALAWTLGVCFGLLHLSVETIWLSSLLLFVGGGLRLELSMYYTSFCDVTPWSNRMISLSFLHGMDGLAGLIGPPIAAMLMQWHLWAPFFVVCLVFLGKYALLWVLPETLPHVSASTYSSRDLRSDTRSNLGAYISLAHSVLEQQIELHRSRLSGLRTLSQHRGLTFVFISFVVKRIGFASEQFASQYVSEILRKPLWETFWLRASNCVGMIVVLLFIMPRVTQEFSSPKRDKWAIRWSLAVIILGFLVLWLSLTLPMICLGLLICGLGEAFEVGLQSLGSFIVGETKHALFFTFASMLGVFGELIGGPIMAWMYSIRNSDHLPAGYCFLLSAVLFGCLLLGSTMLKLNPLTTSTVASPAL